MSYNIDTMKVKSLNDFQVPVASLYKHERDDWHPTRLEKDGRTMFKVMDSCKLIGRMEGEILHVEKFQCVGEGSGVSMDWVFEPAFKDSHGELVASCVWEGGDTINQLRVKDGKVTWKDIEI